MSPLAAVIFLAACLVLAQFILGARGARDTRRIYAYLLQEARLRARRSISIIVSLEQPVETLYPLLNHLYNQHYDKLQIIIVVKQAAGSRTVAELQTYRRRNHCKDLRIIRYKKGLTTASIVRRYAQGDYCMEMAPSERLSPRFFMVVSQVLATTKSDALAVREAVRPSHTFARAFYALAVLFRQTGAALTDGSMAVSHSLVRRRLYGEASVRPTTYAPHQFYVVSRRNNTASSLSRPSSPRLSWRALLCALLIGVAAATAYSLAATLLDGQTAQLYAWIMVVAIEAAVLLCMVQWRGFYFFDYINVVLFVPLVPLYAFMQIAYRLASALVNVARHRQ